MTEWTPEKLLAFEAGLAQLFEHGLIKAPLHLAGGNEALLIELFRDVGRDDWVLGSWRSHYHCLLKGVPAEHLRQSILDGRSIALTFPEHRVLCSAIVGGIAPIAVGLAWAIKRRGGNERVWCFLGDMSARCGIVHESITYAHNFSLPVIWVEEDNGLSVCTDTEAAWGDRHRVAPATAALRLVYRYALSRPHVGIGKFVSF